MQPSMTQPSPAKDKPAVVVSPASDFVDFDPLQTTEP